MYLREDNINILAWESSISLEEGNIWKSPGCRFIVELILINALSRSFPLFSLLKKDRIFQIEIVVEIMSVYK